MNNNEDIKSLKAEIVRQIDEIYDMDFDSNEFVPRELAVKMAYLTGKINREISVYINRKGRIIDVSVGDRNTVSLSEVKGRKNSSKLSGVRCIHTHPNGEGFLSDVDINALVSLRFDAMIAIGVKEGNVSSIYVGIIQRDIEGLLSGNQVFGPFSLGDTKLDSFFELINTIDKESVAEYHINEDEKERAILIGIETSKGKIINNKSEAERSLDELEELADTAGAQVIHKVIQKKNKKDPAFLIGRGKLEEVSLMAQALGCNSLIFDNELSGAQIRNIEEYTGVKVLDRTTLILDIFAQRAISKEGKLQVELAQLKYRLPRLIGLGNKLSRLGGGIGTRGPGEKKLELDRRHIYRKISYLENELKEVQKRRNIVREKRNEDGILKIALVGYTNAGKSTLMNKLCGAGVYVENKLFATLDPTVRELNLTESRKAMLVDTVGFIRNLPHKLIEAFKSTLEEAVYADLLLHVVDASNEDAKEHIEIVKSLLKELGAEEKPTIIVLNKSDMAGRRSSSLREELNSDGDYEEEHTVPISALKGEGIDKLIDKIVTTTPNNNVEESIIIPYDRGWLREYVYKNGKVISEDSSEDGFIMEIRMSKVNFDKIKKDVVIART